MFSPCVFELLVLLCHHLSVKEIRQLINNNTKAKLWPHRRQGGHLCIHAGLQCFFFFFFFSIRSVVIEKKIRTGGPALWGKTKGARSFWPGEEEALVGPHHSIPVLKGHLQWGQRLSSWGATWRRQGTMGISCTRRGFPLIHKIFFFYKIIFFTKIFFFGL